jgi:HPt (histidine-containing phosphotransfer) domain-containing protein
MSEDKIKLSIDIDLEDLIPGFLENRRKDIDSLREALAAGDSEKLRTIGHNLKGVGGGYGFDEISNVGAEIETNAKSGNLDDVDALIARMADYLDRVDIKFE